MIYLSHEHRILRYLAKIEKYGLFIAHKKCMKEGSNDFTKLKDIEEKYRQKKAFVDGIVVGDGEIDVQKTKDLFVEREYMTAQEFDIAVDLLRSVGFLHPIKFKATNSAVVLHNQMEDERNLFIQQEIAKKRAAGDPDVPSKGNTI